MKPTRAWKRFPNDRLKGHQIYQLANAAVILSSAELMVIDLDNHDGKMTDIIKPIAEHLFKLCPTYMVKTKSKGYHLYYKRPTGCGLKKKATLELPNGDFLGDFQVGDALTFIGKGYSSVKYDNEIPPLAIANNEIIKWVKRRRKTAGKTNTRYVKDTTYNPPEGWLAYCRLYPNERVEAFKQLLNKGERHNKMIGFTWYWRTNMLNPVISDAIDDFKQAFYASHDNQREANKEWMAREREIWREKQNGYVGYSWRIKI